MQPEVPLKDGRRALIREVQPEDAAGLLRHVNMVGAEEIYITTEALGITIEDERRKIETFDHERGLWLVALVDGQLVGSADMAQGRHRKNAHTAGLGIAIQEPARGVGLGTALMERMIGWAEAKGVRKVTLSVFDSNERAKGLYRKLGFEEEARLRHEVVLRGRPTDVIMMAKWLKRFD